MMIAHGTLSLLVRLCVTAHPMLCMTANLLRETANLPSPQPSHRHG